YMSPEQAAGEDIDHRSDLYALGIVAYEMLTGKPPFTGPGRVVVSKHLSERPLPVDRARPDCPPQMASAVMRALEKLPADRWQTADELRRALAAANPRDRARIRRRRRLIALGGAAVIAATVFGLAHRTAAGPPDGVDPRHSMLVLPFDNLRGDAASDWLRDGSVSMLGIDLSQWNDLTVVDHERLHDLLARHKLRIGDDIGLDRARRLARDAGVWTVVLGDYTRTGDSLHLAARVYDVATGRRVDVARVDGIAGADVRPLFDELAARLLDLSGAPDEIRAGLAQSTTQSLAAFREYLAGDELLNQWELVGAMRRFQHAIALDSSFGLAYYKLALTRGWIVGKNDTVSSRAMLLATANSGKLPVRDRTMIDAYRAFIQSDYSRARTLYGQLLARDSADADAWYGLGEAWFHDDGSKAAQTANLSEALRAFHRTLALDPNYALAYDHINSVLSLAGRAHPPFLLAARDSLVPLPAVPTPTRAESANVAAGARRARQEAIQLARDWVASQPATVRAHAALVDAYLAAHDYAGAMAEVNRYRLTDQPHPDLPFMSARVRFAAGDVDGAAADLRRALDSIAPADFGLYAATPTVVGDVAAAANVFAYQGDLARAARAIDLADAVHDAVYPSNLDLPSEFMMGDEWRRSALGELYAAAGGPPAALRQIWDGASEAARSAPDAVRPEVARSGAAAAVGLFTGIAADTAALTELKVLSDAPPPPAVQALLALVHNDSAAARRALSQPDTAAVASEKAAPYSEDPLAAEAYYLLGDYDTALHLLEDFEPDAFATRGFDPRWGLLARVRLLRGNLYEKLGRRSEASREYRDVVAQWKRADPALQIYVRQAMQGLGRVSGEG
ncbi:MAG TPA: protein kinase, partial [Gemmatimonadales bacterium]|nr:protein kinase [Gemmatimonadales bacterium]